MVNHDSTSACSAVAAEPAVVPARPVPPLPAAAPVPAVAPVPAYPPAVSSAPGAATGGDRASHVYLDHAATTPMLPEAFAAMVDELAHTGNPSSLHNAGRRARRVVEESREVIAQAFGARPSEVIFTSGGTEADNLAIKGLYWARQAHVETSHGELATRAGTVAGSAERGADRPEVRRRVLATTIEHHAVLDCVQWLEEHEDATAEWLGVDAAGLLNPGTLRAAIEQDPGSVALVSVMWANNEVGSVQPVAALAAVAREYRIPFHSDAVQAAGLLPVSLAGSGASALTITAHKIGGPVGVGALLLARGDTPVPVLHGGGQERDIRSGTLDMPAIRAFAVAVEVTQARRAENAARIAMLRDRLVDRVRVLVPDAILNGPEPGEARLPGNAHFSFPGCEGDALLMLLDAKGIACSTGSACTAGIARPSHVLLAMDAERARASGSLRFSLGLASTARDVDALAAALPEAVERARRAGR